MDTLEFMGKGKYEPKEGRSDWQNLTVRAGDGTIHKYWDWEGDNGDVTGGGAHDLAMSDGVLHVVFWEKRIRTNGDERERSETVRIYSNFLHAEGPILEGHDPFLVTPADYKKRASVAVKAGVVRQLRDQGLTAKDLAPEREPRH